MLFAALFVFVCLAEFFFIAWLSEREHPFLATVTILATVLGAWWYGIPVVSWVYGHIPHLVSGFAVYLILGVAWSVYKWWRLVRTVFLALKERLVEYPLPTDKDVQGVVDTILADQAREKEDPRSRANTRFINGDGTIKRDDIATSIRQDWKSVALSARQKPFTDLIYDVRENKFEFPVREYKGKIITWMAFWPFSLVWTLIDDLVVRLWENLYKMLTGIFRRISEAVFRDLNP
jgi:hypothetical protein